MSNTKAPYNISTPTAALAQSALSPSSITTFEANIAALLANRAFLLSELPKIAGVGQILGQPHANFVLVQIVDGTTGEPDNVRSKKVYLRLATEEKVVVRFRGNERGCAGCLRITVGTRAECERVLERLAAVLPEL